MTVPNTFANQTGPIPLVQLDQNFAALGNSANVSFTQTGTSAATRTVASKLQDVVSVKDFGAVGNGITVDTAAIQAALNTGKSIVGVPGETYLIGPLTQSTNDQVIDFTGCTLTRINSSAAAAMLTLNGSRVTVVGGRWNGNKAGQSGTVNDQYAQAAVTIVGDYCVVDSIESNGSWGIGIKGQNCSYAVIRSSRCIDSNLFGIFVEGASSDEYGNEIVDNYVSSTGIIGASGIYLTGTNDFLINQYYWTVSRNTVQLSQNASVTGICITTRGYDGVCAENNTTGGTMGISGDSATRSTFSGNRCSDTSGLSDYGIEINNALCTVVGNAIKNTKYGVSISGAVFCQNYTTISGNVINPKNGGIGIYALGQVSGVKTITGATSANPIQFTSASHGLTTSNFVTLTELPGAFSALNGNTYSVTVTGANTFTVAVNGSGFAAYTSGGKALRGVAQYLNIIGNTIKFNAPSALTGGGGACIYLAGTTEYSTVSGNLFVGCGNTIPSGIGVYLDNTGGYCSILGNKFSGLSEAVTLYSGTPRTFTDISFNANDLTYDCPGASSILTATGSATIGARVTQMFNATSGGVQTNIIDTAAARQISFSDGVTTPEGNVTGGLGSIFSNYGYGEGNTLYIKETGSGNTGWVPVNSAYATFAQLNDSTAAINTLRKRYGRLVTDTTNNRQFFASGTAAADPWYSVDGTQILTPGSGLTGRDITIGGVTLSGTNKRVVGDFTNATVSSRALFQTSTANSTTAIGAMPNGTGTVASWDVYNTNDPNNASRGQFQVTNTEVRVLSSNTGTGSVLPFGIYVGGAQQAGFGGTNSSMRSLGSFGTGVTVTNTAATYTVGQNDYAVRFATNNCTVTLPSASTFNGRILILLNYTAVSVTSASSDVVPLGSNTAGTAILAATAGKFAMLQSDGSLWYTLMSN